jgi:hypothetical protein
VRAKLPWLSRSSEDWPPLSGMVRNFLIARFGAFWDSP